MKDERKKISDVELRRVSRGAEVRRSRGAGEKKMSNCECRISEKKYRMVRLRSPQVVRQPFDFAQGKAHHKLRIAERGKYSITER